MRFRFECPLRWSDMDAFGHVNNARMLTLYEEARVALMFTAARQRGLDSLERGVVIHRHEVDYLLPVRYEDPVTIELWVSELRPSRFTVRYELLRAGAVASRALSVCVPFDLVAGRPRRLAAAEREFLAPWDGLPPSDGLPPLGGLLPSDGLPPLGGVLPLDG